MLTGELSQYLAKVNNSDDLALKITSALEAYPKNDLLSIERFSEVNIYDTYKKLYNSKTEEV